LEDEFFETEEEETVGEGEAKPFDPWAKVPSIKKPEVVLPVVSND